MKQSRRANRMDRHHKRHKVGALNLVALMDIFTILVFFLLVNSSDVQNVPSSKAVQLPESTVQLAPRETVVVMVTETQILVQGELVAETGSLLSGDQAGARLKQALLLEQAKRIEEIEQRDFGEVTILGDKGIPFDVLKKVMSICTDAGFGTVSLAVLQKGAPTASGGGA